MSNFLAFLQLSPQAVGSSSQYEAVRSAVQDACIALTDQRGRNAEQAFSRALGVLAFSTAKVRQQGEMLVHGYDML